ncbi:hypothetical protein [uncultured Sphingomonas sp.]|uniref:hypothetical protein n=1 Tax=uncultured Sphingomonas sp. TaxID=158754 RepID=UPI0035CB989D
MVREAIRTWKTGFVLLVSSVLLTALAGGLLVFLPLMLLRHFVDFPMRTAWLVTAGLVVIYAPWAFGAALDNLRDFYLEGTRRRRR